MIPMVRKLLVALFAPLLLVAGCSDDGDGAAKVDTGDAESALAAVRAAPDAALEAGSGRMEMTMSMTFEGQTIELNATGAFAGTQAQIEMDFGAMLEALEGAAGEEAPPGFDEPMQIVVDGATMYMRWPFLSMMAGGTEWMSVSAEEMGLASDSLGTGWAATNNPAQMLEMLRGISSGDIEELGDEEIRGTDTTGYAVTIDLAKAAEQMPDDFRAAFEQSLEDLSVTTMPMDVWLGDDGLVRRISLDAMEMLTDTAGAAELESGQLTMDFFDYGADVEIAIPDASEVTPFTEVMGGLGGAMG
jgi:hypothetical protein